MSRYSIFYILLFFFLVAAPRGLYAGEPSDETARIASIINKVIDAYGGKDAIEGIHSFHMIGEIEAFMMHDQGPYELYFKRGRQLRVGTKYQRSSELRILNSDRGYRRTDTLPLEEVYGPRFVSMVYQYKHLNLLHDLIAGAYQIRSAGPSAVAGENAEIFRFNDKEDAVLDVYIDKRTFLVVKVTAFFSAENKQIDLSAEFSDFRKVGGSVFPFRITNYAGGVKVAQTVIEKYALNPEMPDSLFVPSATQSF